MAIINKRSSGTNLLATASWGTGTGPVPGTGDIATWITGSLGGSLTNSTTWSVGGIDVQAATAAISISTAQLSLYGNLTIAAGGVDLTFNSSIVSIATASNVWNVGSGRILSVGSIATSGNAWAFSMNGAGTTVFRSAATGVGSSTFSISNGVVQVGNATSLGGASNTITMTGGKLSSSSMVGYGLANALTLNGTMTLGDATNNGVNTFSGILTVSGASTLTAATAIGFYGSFQGSGNLSLGGNNYFFTGASNNTYSGALTLTSGGISLANYNSGTPNQLGTTSSLTFNSDLQILGNTAYTFANTIGGTGTVYIRNTSASGITFNGSMASYTGSLRTYADSVEGANPVQKITLTQADQFGFSSFWFQSGGGPTSLSQTLSYTGSSFVDMGAPFFVYVGAGPATTTKFSNNSSNGSTFTQSNVLQLATAIGSTFTMDAATGPIVLRALQETSTGVLAVSKTGSNVATIAGLDASNYRGAVLVTTGTLNANNATALGAASSTAAISVTSGATLSLGAALNYSSPGRTTTIGGTGVLTGGALIHNYAGTVNIGVIALGSASYIRGTATGSLSSGITATTGALTLGAAASTVFTLPGALSSNLLLTFGNSSLDTGEVILSGFNSSSLTGAITVNYGTLSFASQSAVGAIGTLTLTRFGSVVQFNVATTSNRPITGRGDIAFKATGSYSLGTISIAGGNGSAFGGNTFGLTAYETATLTSNVDFLSSISYVQEFYPKAKAGKTLTLQGTIYSSLNSNPNIYYWAETGGSIVINGTNYYDGYSILYEGTIQAASPEVNGVSGPFGIKTTSGSILMYSTGTLQYSASNNADYSGRFDTTGGERWKIDTNGQSVTFASSLQGTGSLVEKLGTGTLTLTNTNTYTGSTTATTGTLRAGNVQAFGTTGTTTIAAGATLQTLTTGGQNGKLTVAALNNAAGGTIKIGG